MDEKSKTTLFWVSRVTKMPLLDLKKKLKLKRLKTTSFWWDCTNNLSSPVFFMCSFCNPQPTATVKWPAQLLPAVPPQPAPAKSRQDLVDGQVQQIHEPAGAAAAHGCALRSSAASDLCEPAAPRRGLVRQERLSAPADSLARHDLVWLVNKGSKRKIRKWVR
jgi:hypothetical protein